MDNLKIIVATHKKYDIPQNNIYLPVFVGSKGKEDIDNYQRDDEGENISDKNPYYCELTAIYWAWKNLDANYIGLVHYRRLFSVKKEIATEEDFEKELLKSTIIVPKKRKYYIESLYTHYSNTHYEEHLQKTREIIKHISPEYLVSYDKVMTRNWGYMFNMFIMGKSDFDEYCQWLFEILEELESVVDYKRYDQFQSRLFGRVSELLFNVWLDYKKSDVAEMNWMYTEKIRKINKLSSFLKAKFYNKKFNKSF